MVGYEISKMNGFFSPYITSLDNSLHNNIHVLEK